MEKIKIGVIGCGNISPIYFTNLKKFDFLQVAACSDLLIERAKARANEYKIPKACSVKELLADPEIKVVLNLTIPIVHAEVDLQILTAGKHSYAEKPLAANRNDGKKVMSEAKKRSLRVGSAPDTFLGGGIQTCRKLIDDGFIGKPVAGTSFMLCHGHETWHPDPDFYYQKGGGPMFDMGPYYLTALINLLGPVKRVAASTKMTFPERLITSQPKNGTIIKVNTTTHLAGVMDFANGAIVSMITSFDVWSAGLPCIEIYGTEGCIRVPDPNGFGGPVVVFKKGSKAWAETPLSHGYSENSRGLGVADMAKAIISERKHRASGDMAFHVLDIMQSYDESSDAGRHIEIKSTCERPQALPAGLGFGQID